MLGKQINNYRITRLIGEGGMASVYEAEHVKLHTKVAIKVMKPELLVIDNIKARFLQEAQIMAGLDHPHIVRVIDYVEGGSTMAIVMEYLEGEDLSEKIKRGGALSAEAAKGIFAPVLDAFIYAHGKGLVHRDVKPSNIFVCKDGSVKIMDFGIAKLIDGNNSLTRTGAQMGTPTYMSPEQVEESKHIDQRSDIYSLGVTLFYMLDGAAPYDSTVSNFAIFNRIHSEPLPRLEGIEGSMRGIIAKATSKKAVDRFTNCEKFKSALMVGVSGSNVSPVSKNSDSTVVESVGNPLVQDYTKRPQLSPEARKVTSKESSIPKQKKFPIVLLLVLLLVSGVGFYLYNSYQSRESVIEVQSPAISMDESSYNAAKVTNSIASYEGYIKSYPQGEYVNAAKEAISVLKHFKAQIPSGFAEVEGGTFNMGSTNGEDEEQPVHRVTLSSFAIGKNDVTFSEYDAYCESSGITKPSDQGWGRGNRPVINVSWNDAVAYCAWLSGKTGKHYRLPTEAEWEYAARGGTKSNGYAYSGSNDMDKVGWYGDNSGSRTHPVGQKQSNELGIYDMSGNVLEWCSDRHGAYSSESQDNPQGPTAGSNRVVRGGGWGYDDQSCRSTDRDDYAPSYASINIGFRVVLAL